MLILNKKHWTKWRSHFHLIQEKVFKPFSPQYIWRCIVDWNLNLYSFLLKIFHEWAMFFWLWTLNGFFFLSYWLLNPLIPIGLIHKPPRSSREWVRPSHNIKFVWLFLKGVQSLWMRSKPVAYYQPQATCSYHKILSA